MGRIVVTLPEVRRYLNLAKQIKLLVEDLQNLERKFIAVIPNDGYRLVGPYKVCHKTQRKRHTAWKQICVEKLGQTLVDEILKTAPFAKPSHSIKIERREDVEEVRKTNGVPEHIPDKQVDDYVFEKNELNFNKGRRKDAQDKD